MVKRTCMICWIVAAAFTAGCVTTSGGPTVDSGAVVIANEDFRAAVVFSDADRASIRDYYRKGHKNKALPPGLAKKDATHPGVRNHIRKFRELPPDVAGERLPPDLERTLSGLPPNYVRLRVGGDVVLMHEKTRYVLDVVFDLD